MKEDEQDEEKKKNKNLFLIIGRERVECRISEITNLIFFKKKFIITYTLTVVIIMRVYILYLYITLSSGVVLEKIIR
jgi:hypothetical protein